jgi:hypothetical protein
VVRCEPTKFLETPRFSGVRTFMRLPNVQGLENADATIVGTYAPGTRVRSTSGVTGREMVMLMRGVASRGLVGMDIVEVAHTLNPTNVTSTAAVRIIMDTLAVYARSKR